jgi:hypothetical protein
MPEPIQTTLTTANGFYVTAEAGGGREVACTRAVTPEGPGPWEQWRVHVDADDPTIVSLQAHDGHYLTAELDGTAQCRATEVNAWERFTMEVRDGAVAFRSAHDRYLCAEGGGGTVLVADRVPGPTIPGEWEFFRPSVEFWRPAQPIVDRPLIGPLRIQDKLFVDDTGTRRVFFCSWFPALRILRDTPTEFYRQLDAIVRAGFQGFRTFLAVGGWTDYWDGREVAPVRFQKWYFTGNHLRTDEYGDWIEAWPNYDDLLRELLRACIARGLRLHVTTGDMQIICPDPQNEIDLHRRFARICAEEGGTQVIALAETTNEFPLNRYGGDSPESIAQMGRILDVWRATIPGLVTTAQGAIPANEEPAALEKASTHGEVCAVHVSRDPFALCLKRTLGLVYWEGDYRAFPKPYWEGEPAGPGEDSYARQDDPANLVALYAMHALTGQASNWFQGAAVRSFQPLESEWGFTSIAHLLAAQLPEDVATWDHGSNQRGGIEYWWKGQDFRTVVYDDWDPSPPRPVASWTLYTGTSVVTSTGQVRARSYRYGRRARPAAATSPGTGLLVGRFA